MMSLRILAFDTTTEACSVALWNRGEQHAVYSHAPREHAQKILPMIEQVLNSSGIGLHQLDGLAFSHGPGSFTGIRIATSVVQGLGFAANLPVLPVSTLEILAEGTWRLTGYTKVLSAIDARMGEIYWGGYSRHQEHWQIVQQPAVFSPNVAIEHLNHLSGSWAYSGSGWTAYPELLTSSSLKLLSGTILLPDAQDILPLALKKWDQGKFLAVDEVQPLYLRNTVAWKKLTSRS